MIQGSMKAQANILVTENLRTKRVLAKAQRNHMNPLEIMWAKRKTLKEKRVLEAMVEIKQ